MFNLYVKSDNNFGKLDIIHPENGLYSDGVSEFSDLFSYILEGNDLENHWQSPSVSRLRARKKLPDYIITNSGPCVFSEAGYDRVKGILNEGYFLPVKVEKTGEYVFYYQPPVLSWRDILNSEYTLMSLVEYKYTNPVAHAISLKEFLSSPHLNGRDWYLHHLGIIFEIFEKYSWFHFHLNDLRVHDHYFTPYCTPRFKNFVEEQKLTGFDFRPIPYSVVKVSEGKTAVIESWSPHADEAQTNQEPVSTEPERVLDPNFIPSEADVLAFEKSHAIRFPEDYRQYVLKFNRGIPFPNELILQAEPPEESEEIPDIEFESWREIGFDFTWDVLPFYNESPKSIVIGRSIPQGDSFLMFLEATYTGQVYFVSHECGENIYDTEGPDNNPVLQYVASSFSEFLSLIQTVSPEKRELDFE
jgi:hypothetical protein